MPPFRDPKKAYGGQALRKGVTKARSGQRQLASRQARFTQGRDRVSGFYGRYPTAAGAGTGELKFWDVTVNSAGVGSAGLVHPSMNLIPQLITESGRIGRKCTIKSINWRMQHQLPGSASGLPGETLRVILFLDKQCNGATASVSDILANADYQSFNNLANKDRFRTLMDRVVDINETSGADNGAGSNYLTQVESDSFFMKCDIPIEFSSTTGAITEIRSNNIGVLLISRADTMDFQSEMRLRFTDQ